MVTKPRKFFVRGSIPEGNEDMRVTELMDNSRARWNSVLVRSMFPTEVAEHILNITLSRDTSHLKVTGEWKTLWRLNIPNRVKLLLWRMMRGCLPVRTNLQRKRVSCPATCPLCDAGLENEFHIFFGCDHSIQCWQASGLWGDVERVASGSEGFQETMMSLLKNLSTQKKRESVMLMWALWKRTNVKVWDGVLNDAFETTCHARQGDRLKCNCDTAMFKELNSFGIGLCIRDEKGKFIRAKTLLHQGIPSAPEAEATGLLDAISWLRQLGLEAVDVEMDCKVVVDAVHGEKEVQGG
ncbi:Ribonuclease H-like superfamily [Sesbania bispinosa]|nr:Ribonuclease H-like superfamily [Sesbania bispinosa]